MVATSYNRGHKVYYNEELGEWLYCDDNTSASIERACKRCGVKGTVFGHDNCLKDLTDCIGVVSACCGHGVKRGYIKLTDGRIFILDKG